ncbi:MAG: porin family protein [bacterium]|nr:porin family protein [bacterium]
MMPLYVIGSSFHRSPPDTGVNMYKMICLSILFCIFVFSHSLYAFDNERQGFILGFGIGFGSISYTQELSTPYRSVSGSESKNPFVTNFKIGYAPQNQWSIYWSSKVNWFEMDNAAGSTSDMAAGYGTISGSYYLKTEAPSFYFSGGFGRSTWIAWSSSGDNSSTGSGVMFGAGYEFSKHWCVELSMGFGEPSETVNGVTLTTNTTAIMLTVNGMLY